MDACPGDGEQIDSAFTRAEIVKSDLIDGVFILLREDNTIYWLQTTFEV